MGLQSDKRGMEELRSAMEDLARGTTAPSSSSLEPGKGESETEDAQSACSL